MVELLIGLLFSIYTIWLVTTAITDDSIDSDVFLIWLILFWLTR